MELNLEHTVALLSRTPATLNTLLRDLPKDWTHANEGNGTWSALAIVGHLIHGEHTDWIPRVKRILEFGEGRAFEPFDRGGHASLLQGKTLPELLDEFAAVRARSLADVQSLNLRPEDLSRRGTHPALGTVTLGQLLATWVAHDLNHLHQLSRVMAHQCREAVGPWKEYLGVMKCDGHSS